MVKEIKYWLIGVWLSCFALVAQADLVVEVTQGASEPTPIAVVPFGWQGGSPLAEDVGKIVGQDLQRSGLFDVLARENMLSFPTRREQVYFRDWRVSGSDYLVIGKVENAANGKLNVSFQLYDVLKEKMIMSKRVGSDKRHLRDAAHYISDQIFEEITGIRGAFSTRIAYVEAQLQGNGKGVYKLMLADWDGARAHTILRSREPVMSPAWSHDGRKLAYVSFESGKPAIYIQHLATGKRERIQSFAGLNGAPAWSPDGSKLALVLSKDGNPEIYILDLATHRLQRVTRSYGIDTEPSWAPDGQSLVFTSDRGGQPQIYRLNLATRDLKRLTFEGNYNARGELTEDGRYLAMVHREPGEGFSIAVQDLKNGRFNILTQGGLDESPTIAPNGSIILYSDEQGGKQILEAVSMDAQIRFRMPGGKGDVRDPAWSPFLNGK